ncbi:hypothetical protein [Actinoallomurus rhizosphaericola]|uniref:hypothetical protein n=1 Tax=Actinoallomurus rhizosphaericola TaxID=2952536 RepID=UPI002093B025|nr:hypothetical protein [Actinoallomurus rhizosphaericola]MCO5996045.1 hypothetical protein [Actinoallomurus rhizosphaericola]
MDYVPGEAEFLVQQHGPRRLWDEVSEAYLRWLSLGRPGRDRFGLTASSEGERVVIRVVAVDLGARRTP